MNDSVQEQIWRIISNIQKKKDTRLRHFLKEFDISTHDTLLLRELSIHPNITLIELAELLNLPKSTVSSMINRLVKRNIVDRTIPENNRRTVQLNISGDFLMHPTIASFTEQLKTGLLGNMSEEDARIILKGLEKLEELL